METEPPSEKKMRTIFVGNPGGLPITLDPNLRKDLEYPRNEIRTTKYTIWTFVPKALLYQFLRFANIYFLFTAIIQSIPYVSPLHPFSAIAPFIFVLSVSMIREGLENYERYKTDKEINENLTTVFVDGVWKEDVLWKDVQVGDFIKITNEKKFPCDIVVLTTDGDQNKGICYIETASLDGEKNLKPRIAISEIMAHLEENEDNLRTFKAKIICQQPNADLHHFDGVIEFGDKKFSLSPKQLLLRGASLRNTKEAIGTVIYTGPHTKIMKNSENSRYKVSKMEQMMNDLVLKLLILQALLYFGSVVGFYGWNLKEQKKYDSIPKNTFSLGFESLLMVLTYFVLYNTLLPISLIVTIDVVKIVQSFFISVDKSFWNEKQQQGCKVMTRSLNEELGQVEYVFSDKTGTLTCNVMKLKFLTIGADTYEGKLHMKQDHHSKWAVQGEFLSEEILDKLKNKRAMIRPLTLHSADNKETYHIRDDAELIDNFFALMATCHDCVTQLKKDESQTLNYEGPSPDEICLVTAARQQGYAFTGTSSNTTTVNVLDTPTEFDLISMFQFDNKRKRMSVLIKHRGRYKLFIKGADSAILSRLAKSDQPFLEEVNNKLAEFCKEGLRTLCMAVRILSEEEVKQIKEESLRVDSSPDKKKLLPELLNKIECHLTLLGCSAVEDRLQDRVPEVIANLLEADIKVWMLTGDKMETAENIGLSCNLINSEFELFRLTQYTEEEAQNYLGQYQEKLNIAMQNRKKTCTIIDGKCLGVLLKKKERAIQYLNLMKDCESVICCRVTPMQKAQVVRLVKKNLGKTSLAIGDGANDVNMIQEGDIGVGIYGLEGRQAANASDFAVPEFKALYKLLFVHGRWSYMRNSEMILYFFYKNMLFTIPQLYFIFLNGYSGQSLFDDWYMTFYNLFFTALPLAAKACLDQDCHYSKIVKVGNKEVIQTNPQIKKLQPYFYRIGQRDLIFNNKNFLLWIFEGIWHGFLVWYTTTYSLNSFVMNIDGHTADFWYMSITMFTSIVVIATLKKAFMIRFWTWTNLLSLTFLSSFLYIGWIWASDSFDSLPLSRSQKAIWDSYEFYLIVLLNIGWFSVWEIGHFIGKNMVAVSYDVLIKLYEAQGKFGKAPHFKISRKEEMELKAKFSRMERIPGGIKLNQVADTTQK